MTGLTGQTWIGGVVLVGCLWNFSHAAFQDYYPSARVAALCGAFTALSDDPAAVFYNPGATVKVKQKMGQFSYARLYTGLQQTVLSLGEFAYIQPVTSQITAGIGWDSFSATDLYREDSFLLSGSGSFKTLIPDFKGEIALGASVRYLTRRFVTDDRTASDPVFASQNRVQNASVDLHFYFEPDPELMQGVALGASVRSLNEPDVGFREAERLNREISAGFVYTAPRLAIPFDVTNRLGETLPHAGGEFYLLRKRLTLRAGSDTLQFGGGFGYRQYFSENFSIVIDYAFLWPLKVDNIAGSHRMTLGIAF